MRPGFDTKPVTIRVPATIRAELDKRVREGFGQTDVILEALCQAWGIIDPRKSRGTKHEQTKSAKIGA